MNEIKNNGLCMLGAYCRKINVLRMMLNAHLRLRWWPVVPLIEWNKYYR